MFTTRGNLETFQPPLHLVEMRRQHRLTRCKCVTHRQHLRPTVRRDGNKGDVIQERPDDVPPIPDHTLIRRRLADHHPNRRTNRAILGQPQRIVTGRPRRNPQLSNKALFADGYKFRAMPIVLP